MHPEDNSLESGYHTSNDGFQDPGSTFNPNKGGGFNFLTFKLSHLAAIITLSTVILVCLFGGSALLYNHLHGTKTGTENSEASNGTFKVGSTISVQQTSPSQLLQLGQVNELAVNGQLTVSKSVVLTPSSEPSSPVAGEIYYDQTSNAPYYYNGSEFVSLLPTASPQSVTTLGGTAGVIGLGSGLSITGNKLDISSSFIQAVDAALSTPVVNSLQGLTGSVSFSGGAGIAISGTEVTNTGVVNLTSTNNSVNVTNEGNGTYNLSIPSGAGSVILAPSTAQADSSTNSSIFINKTGSGNTLELQNSGVDAFVVSQTGQITTGTINYSQVQGRPSTVVNSIGGSTGALTLGSGLGLNSNTLSNTGVTSIAGTPNQVIASGSSGAITLSLPQSIATSSSPTFDSQTLNGTLGVTDLSTLTGGVSTTTLNVSGTSTLQGAATADSTLNVQGVLTVGVPGSQGGNIYLSNSSSTNTVDLVGENPSGSGIGTIQFPTIVGGTTDTVCLESLANCGASSNTVTTSSSGTSGDIPKFTGGDTVANSSISDNGSTVTVAELLSASTISTTTIQSSGSLSINPGGTLSIGASNHTLSLTGSSSSTFAESANGFTDTLGFTAPTSSSHNITVPDATGTVCLENSPSCGFATGGSGVTSVDLLAGALSIADSTGTGSTITIQNASTTQAGIAEFDSSDFQSSGGVIDTIQGISSTSDVQFDSLALDNGGTCSAGGNLCLGNNGTVYADNYSNPSSSSNLVIDSGSTNVEFENQSGTNSFLFPTYGGTGQTICTSGITCASGGGQAVILGPSGVQDTSTNTTGIYIDKTGGTGNLLTLQTGSSQNALVIDSSGNATFSNTTTAATLDVSGTLQTETITPNASLTVGSSSQSFTLQGNESSEILGEASGNYTYLGFATPGGNSASSGTIYYALDNSAATNTQGTPYFVCTTAGNCSGAGGSVTALGGSSANYVPLFSSTLNPGGNIEDSIVTETGSNTINVLGSLNVGATGNGQLAVGVASTVNGTIVVNNSSNNKTVTINQAAAPSSNVTLSLPTTSGTFAVSASGPLVLNATTGVLSCPDCDSSGGGGMSAVQSLNGLAGAITINNASVSSQNIQLNYAKADGTTLGIAAFNATDFTDNGSGVIDTAQSIASTASPTFANLTLQGTTGLTIGSTSNDGAVTFLDGTNDGFSQKISQTTLTGSQTIDIPNASGTLAVSASGNLSLSALGNLTTVTNPTFSSSVTTPLLESAAALNITPGGTLTAGAANQTFTLQGNASSSITSTSGSYTSTLSFDSPTSNNAIYLPNQGGTICLSSNNCSYEASGSYILNQTTQQTSANIDIAGVASNVAAKIQGASGQNILNLYSSVSSSTPVAYFDSAGDLLVTTNDINGATITGGALSGGNVSGSSLSSTQLTFTGASGAIATTGATSLSLDTGGAASLNLGTTNATGIIIGSTSNTSSTSIIANTTLNLGNNANSKTINVGATGSTANTTALNLATSTGADQTVDIGGTGGSGTNSNSSTTITLQGGTTSESLTGSGETLTTYTNSASAFVVQNSSAAVLTVDTSNQRVDIGTNGTESGQLYVGGTIPTYVGENSDSNLSSPTSVYVSGNYAYVVNDASTGKLLVYNISSGTPVYVGENSDSNLSSPTSVYVSGNYAYVVGTGNNKLTVYNISSGTPVYVSENSDSNLNHPYGVYVSGNYAYVASYTNSELVVYNISSGTPVYVGENSDSNLSNPRSDYVSGNYAYVINDGNNKLAVYNISSGTPVYVGQNSDSNLNIPYYIYVSGSYAYVPNYGSSKLAVYNISSGTPVYVGQNSDSNLSHPISVYVSGNYAYVVSNGNNELVVYNISSGTPVYVGQNSDSNLSSPQSVYVQGNYAYVISYSNDKLVSYSIGGTNTQSLQAGSTVTTTLQVADNAIVSGDQSIQGGLSVGTNAQIDNNLGVGGTLSVNTISGIGSSSISINSPITQSVSSGSSTGTISLLGQSATNANTGLVSTTVNADSITLIGTNNTNVGENILNGLSFNNVTATTNNTVNGLYFGSGYTNGLDFSSASGFTSFITAPSFNLNTSGGLSLGTIGSAQGSLTLNSSHSGGSFTFQPSSSQSAAINLTIPTDGSSDTICLVTLANCSGSSGGSGDTSYIFNQTTQQSSANIDIDSSSSAVAAKIQGASGQNILNLYGSSSSTTPVDYFDGSGDLTVDGSATFEDSTNSTAAFQILQNSTGAAALTVDTSNQRVDIGTNGTASGQLYVSGTIPTYVGENSDSNTDDPYSVFVSGNYAYVVNDIVSGGKLLVYNISSGTPVYVSENSDSNLSSPYSVYVSGNYAYVTNVGNGKLLVYNISSGTPVYVSENSDSNLSDPYSVYVSGNYAYVISAGNSKLLVYNISSGTPVYVSENSDSNLSTPYSVYVSGNYAYVASAGNNKLVVYNISSGTPVYVSENSDSNLSDPYSVYVSGNYAYVASGGNNKLAVYNISSGTPVYVGENSDSNLNEPVSVYVSGNYAYVVNDANGSNAKLVAYNISSGTPVYVGENSDSNLSFPQSLYVQGNYAYVASYGNNKLVSYSIGGTNTQSLQAGSTVTTTLQVSANAIVSGDESIQGGLSVGTNTELDNNLGVGGSVLLQDSTNSVSALQVDNSSGSVLLNVDTSNSRIGLGQVSTPSGASAVVASGGSLGASLTYYFEVTAIDGAGGQTTASAEVHNTTATSGTCTASGNCEITVSWTSDPGAIYYKVYYATSSGGEANYFTSTTNSYTFSTTTGNTSGTPPTTGNAYVNQLTSSSSGTNVLTNTTIQTATNSTTAFQIQNATGASILTADTSNNRIDIGTNGTASGQLYVGGTIPTYVGENTDGNLNNPQIAFVSGNYAYVINGINGGGKLLIYNISSHIPVYVSQNSDSNLDRPESVYVSGNYAYVANYSNNKLLVYNISSGTPVYVGENSDSNLNEPYSVYVAGIYAYVASSNSNKLVVYNISSGTPVYVGENSDSNLSDPHAVYVSGNYAYVVNDATSGKLLVYNISSGIPVYVGQNSDSNLNSPYSVYVQGSYAYVVSYGNNKLAVYNISSGTPVYVGENSDSSLSEPLYAYVSGSYAYVTNYVNNELVEYNISSGTPVYVGENSDSNLDGPRSVYVQGNYAYIASSSSNKLVSYSIGGTNTQSLQAGSTVTTTLQVSANAIVSGDESIQGGLSVGTNTELDNNLGVGGSVLLQDSTNSVSALQVDNSSGSVLLNVDTSNSRIGLGQVSTPSGASAVVASGGSLGASLTYYFEVTAIDGAGGQTTASAEVHNTTATSGTCTASGNCEITVSWTSDPGAIYYKVYYATSSGGEANYFTSTTNSYTFSTTTGNTSGTPPTTGNAYVNQLTSSSSGTNVLTNTTIQTATNSTTAFQIQNATGASILTADTSNNRIDIGTNGTASGQLYVGGTIPTYVGQNSDTNLSSPRSVFVSGNYAYVTSQSNNKLVVYNISSGTPVYVSENSDSNLDEPWSVYVSGNYAYVASYGNDELAVYNISSGTPVYVGENSDANLTNPWSVYVSGNYAYVVNGSGANAKLLAYNISSGTPVYVGENSDSNLNYPESVYISGNYAYVASDATPSKLLIYNISSGIPVYVSENSDSNINGLPQSIYVSGSYAYIVTNVSSGKLLVYNISSGTPVYVGQNTDSNLNSPYSVYVSGNYAYVASFNNNKLVEYNISSGTPVYVGENSDSNLSGPFSVFVQGNYAYVASAGTSKLVSYNIGGTVTQSLQAGSTVVTTLQVSNNSIVSGDQSIQGGLEVGTNAQVDGNLGVGGSALFENTTNSTSALQIQNSSGASILTADTSNNRIDIGTNGTESGQLYVSGTNPTYVGENSDGNLNNPQSVFISGNYAYVASEDTSKLAVYNISSGTPVYVGENSDSNLSNPVSVYVSGNYAYVASQTNSKLVVYNISSGTPVYVSENSDSNLSSPTSIYVSGNYAYVASDGSNKLVVYNISSGTPVYVGENSDSNLNEPYSVYVAGNYAYVASTTNNKLVVYNISSGTPVYVGENSDSNLSGPISVYVQGNYAYVASYSNSKLVVYNISSGTPVYVSENSDSNLIEPLSLYISGNYAYVASYGSGGASKLVVYNISSGTPVYVGENSDSNLSNPHSIYVQGNYAYVASGNNELVSYNIGGTVTQSLQAGSTVVTTLQVSNNSIVSGDQSIQGGLEVGTNAQIDGNLGVNGISTVQQLCVKLSSCVNALGVEGNIAASGSVTGGVGSPDYAEEITATNPSTVSAGDLVSMDPNNPGQVVLSSGDYDPNLIGAISTHPGFITNALSSSVSGDSSSSDASQVPLALAGRIPVNVDGENGPIEPGDYITSSSVPGYGMKADGPGAVVGIAMSSFSGTSTSDEGTVLMFVENEYYNPDSSTGLQGSNPVVDSLTVNGAASFQSISASSATIANLNVSGSEVVDGNLDLDGVLTADGPVALKDSTNSQTAFLVQNSLGSNILSVDTTSGSLVVTSTGNSQTALEVLDSSGNVAFVVDAGNKRVGINTSTPGATLSVNGGNNINPEWPDGLVGKPIVTQVGNSSSYTVPSGDTLYITNLVSTANDYLTSGSGSNTVNQFYIPANTANITTIPEPEAAGSVLSSSTGSITITGMLISEGVLPIVTQVGNSSSYTVPSGDTLYITNLVSTANDYLTSGSGSNTVNQFYIPANTANITTIPEPEAAGSVLSSSTGSITITGYLTSSSGLGE